MASLDGTDLGDIQSEEQSKDSGLFQTPLPRQDSANAILIDLFGVIRTLTITGIFKGTVNEQNTFITAIEGIADGVQTGSTFVSSIRASSITVLIQNFRWTKQKADPNKIDYTLTLIQGTVG